MTAGNRRAEASFYFNCQFPRNPPHNKRAGCAIIMTRSTRTAAILCFALVSTTFAARAHQLPNPAIGPKATGEQTAVLAGGCFWGVEAVFEALVGVKDVVSGYAGGSRASANYHVVSSGTTGHAESVRITYDPTKISYGQLLKVFFAVAHDPTQLNRQGPDEGPQYRSAIFVNSPDQKAVAEAYIKQLSEAKTFTRRIVTTVVSLDGFYPAEPEHQDFIRRNPRNPYVLANDRPKLEQLDKEFPELLKRK
jgi:peptide-methionine (S)-S-oxide reductase